MQWLRGQSGIKKCSNSDPPGTFKLKKRDLQEEGFNPDMMGEDVYIKDDTMKTYVMITQETYNNIVNGNMRF